MDALRAREFDKYETAYREPGYRMKGGRLADAREILRGLPYRSGYLDVACGRGEMLRVAETLGFAPVRGTEIVPALVDGTRVVRAEVRALPFADKSFDVATLFDVIEHLIPGDDEAACREMRRVARRFVVVMANNFPSHLPDGRAMHINIRPYAEWDRLFRLWFEGCAVERVPSRHQKRRVSETWLVTC